MTGMEKCETVKRTVPWEKCKKGGFLECPQDEQEQKIEIVTSTVQLKAKKRNGYDHVPVASILTF